METQSAELQCPECQHYFNGEFDDEYELIACPKCNEDLEPSQCKVIQLNQ